MRVTCLAVIVLVLTAAGVSAQQSTSSEREALAQGWSLLSQGEAAKASAVAAESMQRFPRSVAVLSLAVEVEISRGGAAAGLSLYDRWLGKRRVEDAYVLRQIARAFLRQIVKAENMSLARLRAIEVLTADGDTDVGGATDPGSVAEAGRQAGAAGERAVDSLVAALDGPIAGKSRAIQALARSRSPRAVKPLIDVLADSDPLARAAAADALGKIGSADAVPALKGLLNDPVFPVHLSAAGALLALKDTSGLAWLRQLRASEHAGVRLAAVQAAASDADAEWMKVVRSLTKDDDPEIRRQAAVLLAPHDPEAARAALEPLLKDPNPAQREAAAASYLEFAVTDFAVLRRFLRTGEELARVNAAARILELTR